MNDGSWLDALDHELELCGLTATARAEALVEVASHLADAGVGALDHFGPPAVYARSLAVAAGLDPSGSGRRAAGGRPAPGAPADARGAGYGGSRPVLWADQVSRSRRGRVVLAPVSMTVAAGDVVALIGSNGAGKSTLLRILAGLERPGTGHVERHCAVGWVPQEGGLDPYLRPHEHFVLFGSARGLSRSRARQEGDRLARELGWESGPAPVAGELSGGTAQKLSVVLGLLGSPGLLLLDEPYQGLDAASTRRFWDLLWHTCDQGTAAVVSSHDPDVLRRASHVIELSEVGA